MQINNSVSPYQPIQPTNQTASQQSVEKSLDVTDSVTISAEAVQQSEALREPVEKVGTGTTPYP